jgi:hypothetical protein
MRTLNRILLTLVAATVIALAWSGVSRTDWAASLSLFGVGQNYEQALQPVIQVAAAVLVMVTATQLVQSVARLIGRLAGRNNRSPASAYLISNSPGNPQETPSNRS